MDTQPIVPVTTLPDTARHWLLSAARHTITAYLQDGTLPALHSEDPLLQRVAGLFVTLWRRDDAELVLRGCIGQMQPHDPLYKLVPLTAVSAATRDKRFPAILPDELPQIQIEISILSTMQPVASLDEIEIGTHGLMIEANGRHGLLLPQVPVKRGWSPQQFFMGLCLKIDLPLDCWPNSATLYKFTAEVFAE